MLPDLLEQELGLLEHLEGVTEEEKWARLVDQLKADPDLAARVFKQFGDEPSVSDPYPVPFRPPEAWFARQSGVPAHLKVSVYPNGRVLGRFFEWGECIVGMLPGECWTPAASLNGYENFHQNDVEVTTAAGGVKLLDCGLLVPGHSPPDSSTEASIEHYNDPTTGVVRVRAYEDEHGAYITGSLVPWATYGDAALVTASALSGHWVWREQMMTSGGHQVSGYDCIGPSMVVRPGLPLRRRVYEPTEEAYPVAASARPLHIVSSVVASNIPTVPKETTMKVVSNRKPLPEKQAKACSCSQPAEAPKVAVAFDGQNDIHVMLLEALVGIYGAETTITDIDGEESGVAEFTVDGVTWSVDFAFDFTEGTVTIGEPTEATDEEPETPQDEEAKASATETEIDIAAEIRSLKARNDDLEAQFTAVSTMVAQLVADQITAPDLTLEETVDPAEQAAEG